MPKNKNYICKITFKNKDRRPLTQTEFSVMIRGIKNFRQNSKLKLQILNLGKSYIKIYSSFSTE